MAKGTAGRVKQVMGAVVDVEFPAEQLPEIYDSVEIAREGEDSMVLEVQQHLGSDTVRTIAMDATDGTFVTSVISVIIVLFAKLLTEKILVD